MSKSRRDTKEESTMTARTACDGLRVVEFAGGMASEMTGMYGMSVPVAA
jgi:hypothetical protein